MNHRTNERASAPIGHPAAIDAGPLNQLQWVERLTLAQQFRLIEIAQDGRDLETRKFALIILRRYLDPPVPFVASNINGEMPAHG